MNQSSSREPVPSSGNGLPPPRRARRRFRMVIPCYPAFNIYSNIARHTTALGPVWVATVVSQMPEWDVEVIDENNYRRYGPRGPDGRPDHATLQAIRAADVVGFYGGLSSTIPRLHELARYYRSQGVVTVAGGQHFVGENIREALEQGVDYVVLGEGEDTIRELLNALESGADPVGVRGIAFRRDGEVIETPPREPITDFDRLPIPDFSLLRYAKLSLYPIGWIRGCGMNCEFCTVKGRPRAASPERVLEQIAAHVEKHDARHFFVVDDLFGHNRQDTLRLCQLLADYQQSVRTRLDLTVQIRLDRARDEELLRAMRAAGINTLAVGYESPIAEELAAMDKRIRPEEMLDLTHRFRRAGFLVHGMFIFGYPLPPGAQCSLDLRERVRCFRKFIREARLDTVQVLLPVPLPGTELTARLAAAGRILPRDEVGWEYYDGNFPVFIPDPPLTAEDLHASLRKIMGRFYRFRYMFAIGYNVLTFPRLLLWLHNLRAGWRIWYRGWRNDLLRFGGWVIYRRWTAQFRRSDFSARLARAQARVGRTANSRASACSAEPSES